MRSDESYNVTRKERARGRDVFAAKEKRLKGPMRKCGPWAAGALAGLVRHLPLSKCIGSRPQKRLSRVAHLVERVVKVELVVVKVLGDAVHLKLR